MLKLLLASLVTLLSVTSAFVTPSSSTSISSRSVTPAAVAAVKVPTSLFVSTTSSNDLPTTHLAVAATASVMTTLLAPLAVFAEEAGDYEYGAVAAPGGIGLAVGLGVLAVSSLYNSLFFHGGGMLFMFRISILRLLSSRIEDIDSSRASHPCTGRGCIQRNEGKGWGFFEECQIEKQWQGKKVNIHIIS